MNRLPVRPTLFLPLSLALLLAAGCSSSPMSRIDANRQLYESWPYEVQSAVLEGKAIKGMTPEMVRMALGEPTRIEARGGTKSVDEGWIYVKGGATTMALPNINIGGVGIATGGTGGGGSRGTGTPEETEVIFQNGVVTRVN
jgi:hypothetical protein